MARKDQVREIQALDATLCAQRTVFESVGHRRMEQLRTVPSYWLVAGGAFAGALVQRAGSMDNVVSKLGSMAIAGLRLWPMVSGGFSSGSAASDPVE
ncbi:hypothetical protein [Halopseudomonas pelagia]|uniref:hypothetical protein n=1 Tax=Halopseudomonas pelagia TaxID=553151 RepID=UPI00039DD73E|nr:hypothetical protein [Halopseudomonas pelagia]|tara:strand:+ start:589 stop:879 length:291 start_codon:yes stop_codon:yes gene_type:complete